jgi:hypothetical protein
MCPNANPAVAVFLFLSACLLTSEIAADEFQDLVDHVGRINPAQTKNTRPDAGLAHVSDEAIEHRRQMIIHFAPTDPHWSAKRRNPKYQYPIVACRLALDPKDQEALDYIRYSLNHRGKDDNFGKSALAGLFCRFGHDWPEDLVEAVREEVTSYDGFLRGGTENHIAMRRTAGYLFGERFPDDKFHYDLTGRQLAGVCLKYMQEYGQAVYSSSQVEYLSPAYLAVNMAAWHNVADLAQDERAKTCGRAILDWLMADLAVNYHEGVILPPLQREKGLLLQRYQLSYARSLAQFVAWLYFGGGNTQEDGGNFAAEKYAPFFPHGLCVDQFAVSTWQPHPVIRNVACKRLTLPYMLWQSRGNWPCIEKASLNAYGKTRPASLHDDARNPRYHLRSVYVNHQYAMGSGNFREDMRDPLLRTAVPFAVTWKTQDDRNYLLVAHPFWYTQRKWEESNEVLGDEDWMGISPFCRTIHWENAALLLFDLPQRDPYGGDAAPGSPKFLSERTEEIIQSAFVYIPDTVDEKPHHGDWFFIREGDVYTGIRPIQSGARWEMSRHPGYMRLAMPGSRTGCAIEVGDRAEFGSFQAFQQKMLQTRIDTSRLDNEKQLAYVSSRGHQLRLRHKSPGWLPEASINGTPLDFDRWPIFTSPYISCRDRILNVSDGQSAFTIDWHGEWPVYEDHRGPSYEVR